MAPVPTEKITSTARRLSPILKVDTKKIERILAKVQGKIAKANRLEKAERIADSFRHFGVNVSVIESVKKVANNSQQKSKITHQPPKKYHKKQSWHKLIKFLYANAKWWPMFIASVVYFSLTWQISESSSKNVAIDQSLLSTTLEKSTHKVSLQTGLQESAQKFISHLFTNNDNQNPEENTSDIWTITVNKFEVSTLSSLFETNTSFSKSSIKLVSYLPHKTKGTNLEENTSSVDNIWEIIASKFEASTLSSFFETGTKCDQGVAYTNLQQGTSALNEFASQRFIELEIYNEPNGLRGIRPTIQTHIELVFGNCFKRLSHNYRKLS